MDSQTHVEFADKLLAIAVQAMQLETTGSPSVVRCCDFLASFERVLVDLHIRHLEAAEAETIGSGDERLEAVAG